MLYDRGTDCVVKRFCEVVVAWGGLRHPNVLPLLGVTMSENRFVIVSEWMVGGDINDFVKMNSDADRLRLVCSLLKASHLRSSLMT